MATNRPSKSAAGTAPTKDSKIDYPQRHPMPTNFSPTQIFSLRRHHLGLFDGHHPRKIPIYDAQQSSLSCLTLKNFNTSSVRPLAAEVFSVGQRVTDSLCKPHPDFLCRRSPISTILYGLDFKSLGQSENDVLITQVEDLNSTHYVFRKDIPTRPSVLHYMPKKLFLEAFQNGSGIITSPEHYAQEIKEVTAGATQQTFAHGVSFAVPAPNLIAAIDPDHDSVSLLQCNDISNQSALVAFAKLYSRTECIRSLPDNRMIVTHARHPNDTAEEKTCVTFLNLDAKQDAMVMSFAHCGTGFVEVTRQANGLLVMTGPAFDSKSPTQSKTANRNHIVVFNPVSRDYYTVTITSHFPQFALLEDESALGYLEAMPQDVLPNSQDKPPKLQLVVDRIYDPTQYRAALLDVFLPREQQSILLPDLVDVVIQFGIGKVSKAGLFRQPTPWRTVPHLKKSDEKDEVALIPVSNITEPRL